MGSIKDKCLAESFYLATAGFLLLVETFLRSVERTCCIESVSVQSGNKDLKCIDLQNFEIDPTA